MPPPAPGDNPASAAQRILALVPASLEEDARAAGQASGCEVVAVRKLSRFLEVLREGRWIATLVSFSADLVDDAVVERIAREPGCGSLVLSAPGASLSRALLAERLGAVTLLREPLDLDDVGHHLATLLDEGREIPVPPAGPRAPEETGLPDLIGEGPGMAAVFRRIARVARSRSTVLITGESGTGKELVAQAIHASSDRATKPFVAINCAAIPEHLLESELFGHRKGGFTGALADRAGRFERADGGTLLLDEIGDMSLVLQAKLLRALEEGVVEPVGGSAPLPVDVRVLAATHQDLPERISEGRFREDLYYRLAVVDIPLPPLRERGPDLDTLSLHFIRVFAERHRRPVRAVTEAALARLRAHGWPGNVRELRNVMDRGVLLASGPVLRSGHLRIGAASPRTSARDRPDEIGSSAPAGYPTSLSLADVEADHIARVLSATGGHIGDSADILGIHRNTLTRKVRQYGLEVEEHGS